MGEAEKEFLVFEETASAEEISGEEAEETAEVSSDGEAANTEESE